MSHPVPYSAFEDNCFHKEFLNAPFQLRLHCFQISCFDQCGAWMGLAGCDSKRFESCFEESFSPWFWLATLFHCWWGLANAELCWDLSCPSFGDRGSSPAWWGCYIAMAFYRRSWSVQDEVSSSSVYSFLQGLCLFHSGSLNRWDSFAIYDDSESTVLDVNPSSAS